MKRRHRPLSPAFAALGLILLCRPAHASDPTTADCLAASEASLKSGSEHQLRAERVLLLACASASCPTDIRRECIRRVDEVNAAIPSIIFEVKDAAGNDLSAVKLTMDGEVLADRLDGIALPIDPGAHTFTFETAGQPPLEKHFVIREAQKERHELVSFGATAKPGALAQPAPTPPLSSSAQPAGGHSGLGTGRTLAVAAAGVGVLGLGAGAVFGALAWSKRDSAHMVCPNTVCVGTEAEYGASLWKDAKNWGNASTIAFIAGGASLAVGAVLWFASHGESEAAPSAQVSLGLGTLDVSGRW